MNIKILCKNYTQFLNYLDGKVAKERTFILSMFSASFSFANRTLQLLRVIWEFGDLNKFIQYSSNLIKECLVP